VNLISIKYTRIEKLTKSQRAELNLKKKKGQVAIEIYDNGSKKAVPFESFTKYLASKDHLLVPSHIDLHHHKKSNGKKSYKKQYQANIIVARGELKKGKVIEAYDILGRILEDMEK